MEIIFRDPASPSTTIEGLSSGALFELLLPPLKGVLDHWSGEPRQVYMLAASMLADEVPVVVSMNTGAIYNRHGRSSPDPGFTWRTQVYELKALLDVSRVTIE